MAAKVVQKQNKNNKKTDTHIAFQIYDPILNSVFTRSTQYEQLKIPTWIEVYFLLLLIIIKKNGFGSCFKNNVISYLWSVLAKNRNPYKTVEKYHQNDQKISSTFFFSLYRQIGKLHFKWFDFLKKTDKKCHQNIKRLTLRYNQSLKKNLVFPRLKRLSKSIKSIRRC